MRRPLKTKRSLSTAPRGAYDRSVALARWRWECLRRSAAYRAEFAKVMHGVAHGVGWDVARLELSCLRAGAGILEREFGSGPGAEHYDTVCQRYGLVVLVHPGVAFSEDRWQRFPSSPTRRDGNPSCGIARCCARPRSGEDM